MSQLLTKRTLWIVSIIVALACIALWTTTVWVIYSSLLWIIAVMYYFVVRERKLAEQRVLRTTEAIQTMLIRTLSHHRHDWMNDLQLVYGYIRLGKLERAVEKIEQIKVRMQTDSKMSKLQVPSLVSYLQSFCTFSANMQLAIDVEERFQVQQLQMPPEQFAEMIIALLNLYRFHTKPVDYDVITTEVKFGQFEEHASITVKCSGEVVSIPFVEREMERIVVHPAVQLERLDNYPQQMRINIACKHE